MSPRPARSGLVALALIVLGAAPAQAAEKVIPKPVSIERSGHAFFDLASDTRIVAERGSRHAAGVAPTSPGFCAARPATRCRSGANAHRGANRPFR
jgi:hypothetical protein